jgi:hypothetical protein
MNIACHFKQSSKTTSFRRTLSWRRSGWKSYVRVVPTATTRILCRRFPETCETAGQVFKFVWRLRWKINIVCISLSPFVSFQSRFVTQLLTFPRIQTVFCTASHVNEQVLFPSYNTIKLTHTVYVMMDVVIDSIYQAALLVHVSAPLLLAERWRISVITSSYSQESNPTSPEYVSKY